VECLVREEHTEVIQWHGGTKARETAILQLPPCMTDPSPTGASASSTSSSAFDRRPGTQGAEALEKERKLPLTGWQQEVDQGLQYGLEAAESIVDRRISTFSRGELPHYAGINTFMKVLMPA